MKSFRLISFALLILSTLTSTAQNVIQGTVTPGSVANSVYVAMRPTANITGSLTDFQFALTIPVSVANPAPTYTVTSLVAGLTLGTTAQSVTTQLVGGVSSYVYTFSMAGTGVASATYTSGIAYNIVEVFFGGSPAGVTTTVMLVQLPGGGATGQSNFFVAFNNNADATSISPFYGTGSVNDGQGYAGYSFVPINNIVLPVKFLDFTASKKENSAVLSWLIENESAQTDHYEIERSLNGTDFTKVNTVAAKNNGKSSNSYNLTDLNLASLRSAGIIYYRIKQIDKDGLFIYSTTKNLRLNAKPIAISIYPNPVKNDANISIDLEENTKANITIIDAEGKQLKNLEMQLFKGLNVKKINMASMAAGSYLLKIETPMETKTISVVKAN